MVKLELKEASCYKHGRKLTEFEQFTIYGNVILNLCKLLNIPSNV